MVTKVFFNDYAFSNAWQRNRLLLTQLKPFFPEQPQAGINHIFIEEDTPLPFNLFQGGINAARRAVRAV